MKTLAIIGTAGRKDDAAKLTVAHWETMIAAAKGVIALEGVTNLVSGGAAWADHVAVELSPEYPADIWLPLVERDLDTARYYHSKFTAVIGKDTREQLNASFRAGHIKIRKRGGFKERNTFVAKDADVFLAITFGNKGKVKDGGTEDTVGKMRARGVKGYHLDLNSLKLYPIL